MKKKTIFAFIVLFYFTTIFVFGEHEQRKGDDYIPEIEVSCTKDYRGLESVESIHVGDIFYITVKCSIRCNSFLHQLFGLKRLQCGISVLNPVCIKMEAEDSPVIVESLRLSTFELFKFWVPVSSDGSQKITIAFRCKALKSGVQELRIAFDDNVNDIYRHSVKYHILSND